MRHFRRALPLVLASLSLTACQDSAADAAPDPASGLTEAKASAAPPEAHLAGITAHFAGSLLATTAQAQEAPPEDAAQRSHRDLRTEWRLEPQESGTSSLLVALSVVDEETVWISGGDGTVLRTTDGGSTWESHPVPGADELYLGDVEAVSADTVYLLSAGPGDASRIFKTTDGGRSWSLQFQNAEPEAFFDCLAFWDAESGLAFSDAVDGQFIVLKTEDGGSNWVRIPPAQLPDALPGEVGFASSGTCVLTHADSTAWIGTARAERPRVLHTVDRGRTWTAYETPLVAGEEAGIGSLAFRDDRHGAALGGDITVKDEHTANVALTRDGGRTWEPGGTLPFPGAAYGSAFVDETPVLFAAGPNGLAASPDGGVTWSRLDTASHFSVAFAGPEVGWAVGPDGRITRLRRR